MSDEDAQYLVDNDVLAHIRFRPDAEDIYARLIEQIQAGLVRTVREVYEEMSRYPPVHDRFKTLRPVFEIDASLQYSEGVQASLDVVGEVAPDLYNPTGESTSVADGWLVAVAKTYGLTLVTDESRTSPKKIPAACRHADIQVRCITGPHLLFEMGIVSDFLPEHIDPHQFWGLHPNS